MLIALLGSAGVLISQQQPTAPAAPAAPATPSGTAQLFPTMSYGDFVNAHPESQYAQIPEHYKRQRLTETQWLQLARIFRGAVAVGVARRGGRIGRTLYEPAVRDIAGRKAEMEIMKQIHDESVEVGWWFECSFPRISVSAADPDNVVVSFDVIKHVKCKNFPNRILARLAPFSGRGEGRTEFTVITEKGGHYQRHQLYLSTEAVGYWPGLWSGDTMEARVYDVDGNDMLPAPLLRSAGHSGATMFDMVYPPEIYYTGDANSAFPRSRLHGGGGLYEYLPEYPYYRRSDGQPLHLDGMEGWYYTGWSFVMPLARLSEIDRIEAKLVAGAARAGGGGFGGFGGGDEDEEIGRRCETRHRLQEDGDRCGRGTAYGYSWRRGEAD